MPYHNIVILTGSGISAESGVKTFRDAGGLWEDHRIEEVATPEAFAINPARVQHFYNMRRRQLKTVTPNAAHLALAKLEVEWKRGEVLVVTQNVDNLHERAGSNNLIHMHGELTKARCLDSGEVIEWQEDIALDTPCPCCKQPGNLRPHIVWFGEMPLEMERIYKSLHNCDLFLSIGTSGAVYPAAGFVHEVGRIGGADTVEINLEPSQGASLFDQCIHEAAGKAVPEFVHRLLY